MDQTHQITPLFGLAFCMFVGFVTGLVSFALGYFHGRDAGYKRSCNDRIARAIIDHIKRGVPIPSYYDAKDIKYAQKYGKKHDIFFELTKPVKLKIISGPKINE
jgi:hypothetical protein